MRGYMMSDWDWKEVKVGGYTFLNAGNLWLHGIMGCVIRHKERYYASTENKWIENENGDIKIFFSAKDAILALIQRDQSL